MSNSSPRPLSAIRIQFGPGSLYQPRPRRRSWQSPALCSFASALKAASAQLSDFLHTKNCWAMGMRSTKLCPRLFEKSRFDSMAPLHSSRGSAARAKTGRYQMRFTKEISHYAHAPVLNQAAIEALSDPKMERSCATLSATSFRTATSLRTSRSSLRHLQWIAAATSKRSTAGTPAPKLQTNNIWVTF